MDRKRDIWFNVFFWLLYFLYQWLGLASLYTDYHAYFINACMALPVSLVFSILTVHIFFKRFQAPNRNIYLWADVFACSIILILIRRYINVEFIYPKYFPWALRVPFFSFGKILVELVNLYSVTALYALYYFIRSLYAERNKTMKLSQEKTMAELDLLKAQVQPHFIFNTLNNIYSTAVKNSPDTADLIAHLSGFLEYNLYDSSQGRIPLTTEIGYIEHYMELQKNRYGSAVDITCTVHDEVDDLLIAPLLLLPLVENSFKHGVTTAGGQSWVRIDFSRLRGVISIRIENSKDPFNEVENTNPGGLGLFNVRKRLDLIYPNAHELVVHEGPDSYLVTLQLKNM